MSKNKGDNMTDTNFAEEQEEDFAEDSFEQDDNVEDIPREKRVLQTQAYDKSVGDLISMMDTNGREADIRLDPHYQRSYIWDNKKASLLIESILLNVPIPVIYVEEEETSQWNVVDGLQRLNSLKRFFSNEFKLTGLEVLSELNRQQFSTLHSKAQRILRNGILRVIVILQESHPEIKYDIFLRLNRGAVRLNEQELRNCLYRGPFNEYLKKARNSQQLHRTMGLTAPHNRFVDAELVLRSIAFITQFSQAESTITNYAGKMKGFLNWFMKKHRNADEKLLKQFQDKFEHSLNCSLMVFGDKAFKKIDSNTGVADRLMNRAIFDLLMVGFSFYVMTDVIKKKKEIFELFISLPERDPVFSDAITYGTSDKIKVEYRLLKWCSELKLIM
jgi:hypothetical protein